MKILVFTIPDGAPGTEVSGITEHPGIGDHPWIGAPTGHPNHYPYQIYPNKMKCIKIRNSETVKRNIAMLILSEVNQFFLGSKMMQMIFV